jgi:hypothetical protein
MPLGQGGGLSEALLNVASSKETAQRKWDFQIEVRQQIIRDALLVRPARGMACLQRTP